MNSKLNARRIFDLLKATFKEWSDDNCLRLSAALSYYSIFSIAPLVIIALGIAGWVLGTSADAQMKLQEQLASQMGGQAAAGVMEMVKHASKPESGIVATIVGVVILLFGASGVFGQLKDALNTIWGVKARPKGAIAGFLRERLLSFGMVLVIGFLLLVSLLLSTAVTAFSHVLENAMPLPAFVWGVIGFFLSSGVVTALFAFIFKVLPDAKVEWRTVWIGAAFTALLFEAGKWGLSYYLGEKTASSYGAAGSVVLVLFWVYYASLIIFFGAEFTQVYAKAMGHEIQPAEHAERVTAEERAKQGLEPHPGTPVMVASKVPAETHLLAPAEVAPALPRKETLIPLMAREPEIIPGAVEWAPPAGPIQAKVNDWVRTANQHPFAEIGAALGVGLLVGTLSRILERQPPEVGAKEHFRLGAQAATAAGATLLAGFTPWFRRSAKKSAKNLREAATSARKHLEEISDDLPRPLKNALR